MNWDQLKREIYVWDGAWLDIYVHNTTRADWEQWVNFVNKHYKINFYNDREERNQTLIDFRIISDYWAGNTDLLSTARVSIGNKIQLNAHFFYDSEIENDIDPREFNSMTDHYLLVDYMTKLSKLLGREVTLTPENCPDIVMISINDDHCRIRS